MIRSVSPIIAGPDLGKKNIAGAKKNIAVEERGGLRAAPMDSFA